MGVYLVTTGLSAAIVQSFLIYRYWSLSVLMVSLVDVVLIVIHRTRNPIISSSLGVLVIVAVSLSL